MTGLICDRKSFRGSATKYGTTRVLDMRPRKLADDASIWDLLGPVLELIAGFVFADACYRGSMAGFVYNWKTPPPPLHFYAISILSGGVIGLALGCWKRLAR
jgi:hypothetical protein